MAQNSSDCDWDSSHRSFNSGYCDIRVAFLTARVIFAIVSFNAGVERTASGTGTKRLSKRSRMINFGIDAVPLFLAIINIAPTQKSTGFLVFIVGLVFLFNGAIRIIH